MRIAVVGGTNVACINSRRPCRLHTEHLLSESDRKKRQLEDLEALLRPRDLVAAARTYVGADQGFGLDLTDGDDDAGDNLAGFKRAQRRTIELGTQLARLPEELAQLLPEINCRRDENGKSLDDEHWQCGRDLLERVDFTEADSMFDHDLGVIIRVSFEGEAGADAAHGMGAGWLPLWATIEGLLTLLETPSGLWSKLKRRLRLTLCF